jgi:hypothetical protein
MPLRQLVDVAAILVKLRDGKVTWAHNFGSEAEALEAAGLSE